MKLRRIRRTLAVLGCVVLLGVASAAAVVATVGPRPASGWAADYLIPVLGRPWYRLGIPRPPYALEEEDEAVLAEAEAVIAGRAAQGTRVRLLDADGGPVPAGTAVAYELKQHAFDFGNFDEASPQLERLWGTHRTKAYTLGIWAEVYRDEADAFDFRQTEVFSPLAWQRAVGLKTGWHNVAWIVDKRDRNGEGELRVPGGLKGLSLDAQRERILDWTRRAAEATEGRFDTVNVFNEPLNKWSDPYSWGDTERRRLLADVVRTFREHNTTSQIQVSIGESLTANDGLDAEWLLAWMKAEGLPVDRVAVQAWCNGVFEWGEPMPTLTLEEMAERLGRLAAVGFELDVTEFQAPGAGSPYPFWRWDRERQARWTEAVATVAFGTPGVRSFCYFRSRDNFMVGGGLYGDDGLPDEAAAALFGLIDGWRSAGTATADADGFVTLTGFDGTYDVTPAAAEGAEPVFWRVAVEHAAESPAEARARPVPEPAPASIAGLGPFVTAEHFLDVAVEAAPGGSDRGAGDALDAVMPIAWHPEEPKPRGMARRGDGVIEIVGWWVGGFCFDAVPAEAATLVLDVEVPDRGVPLCLNVFDRTRRYSDEALAPGRYRMRIPVDAGSRPAVQLMPRVGDNPRYRVDGVKQPYALLHAASFE